MKTAAWRISCGLIFAFLGTWLFDWPINLGTLMPFVFGFFISEFVRACKMLLSKIPELLVDLVCDGLDWLEDLKCFRRNIMWRINVAREFVVFCMQLAGTITFLVLASVYLDFNSMALVSRVSVALGVAALAFVVACVPGRVLLLLHNKQKRMADGEPRSILCMEQQQYDAIRAQWLRCYHHGIMACVLHDILAYLRGLVAVPTCLVVTLTLVVVVWLPYVILLALGLLAAGLLYLIRLKAWASQILDTLDRDSWLDRFFEGVSKRQEALLYEV